MVKAKAFVETTILTNYLLKTGETQKSAAELLKQYKFTSLPVYAIKEFKAGPLANYKYIYNKLVTTRSFLQTLAAVQKLSGTPQRYKTSTALEALKNAMEETGKLSSPELVKKYGSSATQDEIWFDRAKLSIKASIYKAWKQRRSVTSEVVYPLKCYLETGPIDLKNGLIELKPTKCNPVKECSLANFLREESANLELLKESIDELPGGLANKRENIGRRKHLREIARKPKNLVSEDACRALGDAYFALACPIDASILTTNKSDIGPLASALGKSIDSPKS